MGRYGALGAVAAVCAAFLTGYLLGNRARVTTGSSAGSPASAGTAVASTAPYAEGLGAPTGQTSALASVPAAGPLAAQPAPVGRTAAARQPRPVSIVASASTVAQPSTDARPTGESASPSGDAPRIRFDNDVEDLGVMHQGEEVTRTFIFRNVGGSTLQIKNVKAECICTGAATTTPSVAPGSTGSIYVVFRSGTMRGKLTKEVIVETNDPAQPAVVLRLLVDIKVEVEASPRGVSFGELTVGKTFETTVMLQHLEGLQFKVVGVTADDPAVHVTDPVRVSESPARYRLTIRVGPESKPRAVNAKVSVHTDRQHSPQVPISVYGKIVSAEPSGR